MQEKKNKRLAILLIILVAATTGMAWYSVRVNTGFDARDLFRLDDYTRISRVVFEQNEETVTLRYNGSRWIVNDAYPADRDLVSVLFATLQQAEAKRPVAGNLRDSVSTYLEEHGVRVSLYEDDQQVHRFLAGGNAAKTQAWFKYPGMQGVYVMVIPGYRVYVSGILELEPRQWKDKLVFNFNWTNFTALEAKFPDDAGAGFRITQNRDGLFSVEGQPSDTSRVHDFLDAVSLLTTTEYLSPGALTDSLRATQPVMEIVIHDVAGNAYSLELFDRQESTVPGLLNGQEGVRFADHQVEAVLRKKAWFRPGS